MTSRIAAIAMNGAASNDAPRAGTLTAVSRDADGDAEFDTDDCGGTANDAEIAGVGSDEHASTEQG
jgi:hypothetical protein